MKKRLLVCTLISLLLSVALAQCQQLAMETEGGKQTVLTKSHVKCRPHIKVTTHGSESSTTFEGVALRTVLEKAGVEFGHSMRGKRLVSCLLVEGTDGYRAVIALPELDPAFTDKEVVLAYLQVGMTERSYRIVIPEENRMAGWVDRSQN